MSKNIEDLKMYGCISCKGYFYSKENYDYSNEEHRKEMKCGTCMLKEIGDKDEYEKH